MQGAREHIARLKKSAEFLVLDATVDLPQSRKAPIALGIFVAVIAAAATGLMPIAVSAVTGACLLLLTRCPLTHQPGHPSHQPRRSFFVVAASLALGRALVETGATDYLTDAFLFATWGAHPLVILGALMALLALLTNVVSNNAAAVVGTPIAIGIAQRLGLPPGALRAGGAVRRQHELRHAHVLPNQPVGDERRQLPVCRVRQGRGTADRSDAGRPNLGVGGDLFLTLSRN